MKSTFAITAVGGECTIHDSEASEKQLELTCRRPIRETSCTSTAEAAYQQLASEIRQCVATKVPSARVRPAERLDKDGGSVRSFGEYTRITGLGTTSDGFDLELSINWVALTPRSSGNTSCAVSVEVSMK